MQFDLQYIHDKDIINGLSSTNIEAGKRNK